MSRLIPGVRTPPAASLWRASTLLLSLLAIFLLYVLPANGLHTQGWSQGSSVVKRTIDKLVARVDIWDVYIEKGRRLHCAMNGDQEAANQYANTPVSHWTDYGDLVKYGWVLDPSRDPYDTLSQGALEDALEELNIDASNNRLVRVDHSRDVTVDGKHYEKSGAYYQSLFNAEAGLIIADDNRNPLAQQLDWTPDQIVPLSSWSDVIFLLWQRVAKNNVQNLGHVIQCLVANEQTAAIMRRAVGKPADFEDWEEFFPMKEKGRTFRPGSDAYYALLYSPNGRGIGWLLTQHKAQLGLKTVSEITIFGADGDPAIYFKIDPVNL